MYRFIRHQIELGYQAYIVYPLVEGAEDGPSPALAASKEVGRLQSLPVFNSVRIGLLHGQMQAKEKEKVIEDFVNGYWQVLVTTSVIEVGVDAQRRSHGRGKRREIWSGTAAPATGPSRARCCSFLLPTCRGAFYRGSDQTPRPHSEHTRWIPSGRG